MIKQFSTQLCIPHMFKFRVTHIVVTFLYLLICSSKIWCISALAGVAQWIECQPAKQGVTGLIPSQGTCLGCGPGSWLGPHKRQLHTDVSLPLVLPPLPSKKE